MLAFKGNVFISNMTSKFVKHRGWHLWL